MVTLEAQVQAARDIRATQENEITQSREHISADQTRDKPKAVPAIMLHHIRPQEAGERAGSRNKRMIGEEENSDDTRKPLKAINYGGRDGGPPDNVRITLKDLQTPSKKLQGSWDNPNRKPVQQPQVDPEENPKECVSQ